MSDQGAVDKSALGTTGASNSPTDPGITAALPWGSGSKAGYYFNQLAKANPGLMAPQNKLLAVQLYQQFQHSHHPEKLGADTYIAGLMNQVGNAYQASQNMETNDAAQKRAMEAFQQRKALGWKAPFVDAGNTILEATKSVIGDLANKQASFLSFGHPALQRQLSNLFQAAPETAASVTTNIAKNLYGMLTLNPEAYMQTGQGLMQLPQLPYAYWNYWNSLKNTRGWGTATGDLAGVLLPSIALGKGIGFTASAEEATGVMASEIEARIAALDEKATTGQLTTLEHTTRERLAQQLSIIRDRASANETYQSSLSYLNNLDKADSLTVNEQGTVAVARVSRYKQLVEELQSGQISRDEFDNHIADMLPEEQATAFREAAKVREAVDNQFNVSYGQSHELWDNVRNSIKDMASGSPVETVAGLLTKPFALTGKGLMTLFKIAGSRTANITYLLGMIDAQSDPAKKALWDLAMQGKTLSHDGVQSDIGTDLAKQIGVDGIWGTAVRDLTDVGLKWVVDDPLASGLRLVGESRSMYGMTGLMGKLFHGTGIFKPEDVDRVFSEYGSFRRFVQVMAKSDAATIKRLSGRFFGDKLVAELGKAKTEGQVLDLLRLVAGTEELALSQMPTMGYYTFFRTAMRGTADIEKFGDLEGLLSNESMTAQQVKEVLHREFNLDPPDKNVGWVDSIPGEKAKILFGMRMRRLFAQKQMVVTGAGISDRAIELTSSESANAVVDFLRANFMSDDFSSFVGDLILRNQANPEVLNNIYDNVMLVVWNRRALATYANPDHFRWVDKLMPQLQDIIHSYTGADRPSTLMDEAMIAHSDSRSDQVISEDGETLLNAAGDAYQLGKRVLPSERSWKQMARFMTNVSRALPTEAETFIRDTNKTFAAIKKLAEATEYTYSELLNKFKHTDAVELSFKESSVEYKAYLAKAKEIKTRMLTIIKLAGKDLDRASQIATMVKHIDDQQQIAENAYATISKSIREESPDSVLKVAQQLKGEMQALRDMGAHIKSSLTTSSMSDGAITKESRYIASQLEFTNKEAEEKYAQKWRDKYLTLRSKPAIDVPLLRRINTPSLGEIGMRTRTDVVADLLQAYNNSWFKVLSLLTYGWAYRVTASEAMLNAFRFGFHDFFRASLAKSIIKNEERFGRIEGGDLGKRVVGDTLAHVILGIDRELLKQFGDDQLERLIQTTLDVMTLTDGAYGGGVHTIDNLVSPDGLTRRMQNKIVEFDPKTGEMKIDNKVRTPKYRKYLSNESLMGNALRMNLNGVYNGEVFKEANSFMLGRIREAGMAFAKANPELYLSEVSKRYEEEIGKITFAKGKLPNAKVENKIAQQVQDEVVRSFGSQELGGEGVEKLRSELVSHMRTWLDNQSPEFLSRFARHRLRSALYPELSPHEGWANITADHMFNLMHNRGELFHGLMAQAESGQIMSDLDAAKWIKNRYDAGAPVPQHLPAPEYVSALGQRMNPLRRFSDYMHEHQFAKIINSLSREPIYVLEVHHAMEGLRNQVEKGMLSYEEALNKAMETATINMTRFVHNPYDKLIYHETARTVAPYWFAKNQAIRRAIRMGIENPAALEKYLKANLAITDFVAMTAMGTANASYSFPGSTLIMNGIINPLATFWLQLQGYDVHGGLEGMGFDVSAGSPQSIIITGSEPGLMGVVTDVFRIPFGPIVAIPAKLVYEWTNMAMPELGNFIKGMLGPQSMNQPIWADILANTTAKNVIQGTAGYFSHGTVGAYASSEAYVMQSLGAQASQDAFKSATQMLLEKHLITEKDIHTAAGRELIGYYASRAISKNFSDLGWAANFTENARVFTAAMFAAKTAAAAGTPFSVSITASKIAETHLNEIMVEKDKNGNLKYPSYTTAMEEYYHRYPEEVFSLMAHSQAVYGAAPETHGMHEILDKHPDFANRFKYLAGSVPESSGVAGQYDPLTSHLLFVDGLRKRLAPEEMMNAMRVQIGNYYYYNVLMPAYKEAYPGTSDLEPISSQGLRLLYEQAKIYGQKMNPVWLADHFGGRRNYAAERGFQELKQAIADPRYSDVFNEQQKKLLPDLIQYRELWSQQYLQASNAERSAMRQDYWVKMTMIADSPQFAPISGIVMNIFRNIPNPA